MKSLIPQTHRPKKHPIISSLYSWWEWENRHSIPDRPRFLALIAKLAVASTRPSSLISNLYYLVFWHILLCLLARLPVFKKSVTQNSPHIWSSSSKLAVKCNNCCHYRLSITPAILQPVQSINVSTVVKNKAQHILVLVHTGLKTVKPKTPSSGRSVTMMYRFHLKAFCSHSLLFIAIKCLSMWWLCRLCVLPSPPN